MDEFLGIRYKMISSENFEDYLKFIEIGFLARKAALSLAPVSRLLHNGDDSYVFTFESFLCNTSINFHTYEEFDELKPDGTKVRSMIMLLDNKMIHTQRESNGRTSKHIREFTTEKMVVTTTGEGWNKVCTRIYVREK